MSRTAFMEISKLTVGCSELVTYAQRFIFLFIYLLFIILYTLWSFALQILLFYHLKYPRIYINILILWCIWYMPLIGTVLINQQSDSVCQRCKDSQRDNHWHIIKDLFYIYLDIVLLQYVQYAGFSVNRHNKRKDKSQFSMQILWGCHCFRLYLSVNASIYTEPNLKAYTS